MSSLNVADRLMFHAIQSPDQIAIASPLGNHRSGVHRKYKTISFRDLDQRSSSIAAGLQQMGMTSAHRIVLLVRFGEDFITLVFALLKSGVTVVLIDPGMGRSNLIKCLEAVKPDGFVAIPQAHLVRKFFSSRFPNAKLNVVVGSRLGVLKGPTLRQLEGTPATHLQITPKQVTDPAAIIFTTGSTGPPKGVQYTHGTFWHQVQQLVEHYQIQSGGRDLSAFPLFGLFNAVMGTTTIIPDMNPIRPADVDPKRMLDAIDQWAINQAFGSPALWTKVGRYCQDVGRRVPTLRFVLSAGAPVPPPVLGWVRSAMHEEGVMYTPYGSTEALPIASIESREVLGETASMSDRGMGTCVGNRFNGVRWKVIGIDDNPIESIDATHVLEIGEIGELMVAGPVVSPCYVTRQDQNAIHKVRDGDIVWHRMGDVGYLDDADRFWFCGRKSHRVLTTVGPLYTEPSEAILNTHPAVYRSALVGFGNQPNQRPIAVVEPWPEKRMKAGSKDEAGFLDELHALARANDPTKSIDSILVYPSKLPTDIRHNSKIFREKLSPWVSKQLAKRASKATE